MFSQFFGNYLLENQIISAEQYEACMNYIKANRVKLGLIAESEGLLTSSQVMELNYLQVQSDERFGDLAVKKGYLTESDVNYLLGLQSNPYLLFVQALDENNCLTHDEIDYNLTAFQKENDYSNSIMKAIRDGNIEGMLPAFVNIQDSVEQPWYTLAATAHRRAYGNSEEFAQLDGVNLIAFGNKLVIHIKGDDGPKVHIYKLRGKIEVTLYIG